MAKLANIARMATATTGTGTLTLDGAVSGFVSFADAGIADGDIVTYAIEEGAQREIGRGTYAAAGPTLTRDTVLGSTAGGAKINLAGAANVFVTPAAEDILPADFAALAEKAEPVGADLLLLQDSEAGGEKKKLEVGNLGGGGGISRGTVQPASGSAVDFTGIPAGVNRITIIFDKVTMSSDSDLLVQIGHGGGLETSDYVSISSFGNTNGATGGSNSTSGFIIFNNLQDGSVSGSMVLNRVTGNTWAESQNVTRTPASCCFGSGIKTLSAELDRLRIRQTSGNLGGGQINIFWE